MSLDVYIKFKSKKKENYFLSHPYSYSFLSESDMNNYNMEDYWTGNITHNLGEMASNIPINETTLYYVIWRPEEIFENPTTSILINYITKGINYMIENRLSLLKFESPNGWGTYEGFLKFLLNYKQACEDNPDCQIEVSR